MRKPPLKPDAQGQTGTKLLVAMTGKASAAKAAEGDAPVFAYIVAGLVEEDFQRIKIQFKALGLIRQIGAALWILTDYGDTVLMRIAAIPSEGREDRQADPDAA
jgi:hypothetical protein